MRLWRLSEPFDHRFARMGRVGGTWQPGEYAERKRPIVIEWEPGSDVVGDFSWPGLDTDIIVTDRVGKALQAADLPGFELRPVEMQEDAEPVKRRSEMPGVRLPYAGPQLWDFWVTAWTNMDAGRSTVTEATREDGSRHVEVIGVQRREKTWDQQRMELVTVVHPRIEGQGLYLPPIRGLFRVKEFPAWIFCTDDVKRLIEEQGFTNVSLLEMGEVA